MYYICSALPPIERATATCSRVTTATASRGSTFATATTIASTTRTNQKKDNAVSQRLSIQMILLFE
jgi:hypothetical protein